MILQTIVTILFVAVAACIIGRSLWRLLFGSSAGGCGSCGGCAGKDPAVSLQVTPLVQLGSPIQDIVTLNVPAKR